MTEWRCASCNGMSPDQRVICYFCGISRGPLISVDEQRQGLEELHHAIAVAATRIERQQTSLESPEEDAIRDRFLSNAFLPSDPALLFDEALRCEAMFRPFVRNQARNRFDACADRLDTLAQQDPSLKGIASILREKQTKYLGRDGKETREAFVGIGLLIAVLAGAVWLIAKACA